MYAPGTVAVAGFAGPDTSLGPAVAAGVVAGKTAENASPYACVSAKRASWVVARFLESELAEALNPLILYALNCGIAMAARIAMMATTINSSIRVKPF
jgi:hypothetical protein